MTTEAHIIFSGIVQGVGFRYATLSVAKELQLLGWVRNIEDGRVEALVQGPQNNIEQLCENLKRRFGDYIKECSIEYCDVSNQYMNFQIK